MGEKELLEVVLSGFDPGMVRWSVSPGMVDPDRTGCGGETSSV